MLSCIAILEKLVRFPTISRQSNLDLVDLVRQMLEDAGVSCRLVHSSDGRRANLLATTGPADRSGVILSGHTDVVPVDGQRWTKPPFSLSEQQGRLYGRGTADMKGFVAAAVTAAIKASQRDLKAPLHLAFSYDEEIGCVGVRALIDLLKTTLPPQRLCIVGEPTAMRVATGHKGKIAAKVACRGRTGHSAMAPLALNAIHLGCEVVEVLRAEQRRLQRDGARDTAYEIPHSTIHVGCMRGGKALNIVPELCELEFEIRNVAADDGQRILARIAKAAALIEKTARSTATEASVEIDVTNSYPGLDTPAESDAVAFVNSLVCGGDTTKVAFGTEGGLFHREIAVPTVICGPGSMEQGHKADEFVTTDQMDRCGHMLGRLLSRLESGEGLPEARI